MVYVPVPCPHGQSTEVIKAGKQANGAQRARCQNGPCERRIFLVQYQDRGRAPELRRPVIDRAINGRGSRDTARVLRSSPTTVSAVLQKSPHTSTRHPRGGTTPSCARRRRPRPSQSRSRNGGEGELCRCQSARAVALACDRSSHGASARGWRRYPAGCGVPEAPGLTGAFWQSPV
jgi:transposase-like protein